MTTNINKSWFNLSAHTHTKKKNYSCDTTHERDSFQFSLEHCRAQIWQCRPVREATAFSCLHCVYRSYSCMICIQHPIISSCRQLLQSLSSTLPFSRHYKADSKNHIQAKPVQGPARLQWELNPIFLHSKQEPAAASKAGGRSQVQQQSCLQYQKGTANDLVTLVWVLSMSYIQNQIAKIRIM